MTPMLVRRTVRSPLNEVMDEMTREFFAPFRGDLRGNVALSVIEDTEGYVVHIQAPGVDPQGLEINLENRVLTIKGEFKQAELPEGARYHLNELPQGRFERAVRFPQPINGDAVEATYEQGIFKLRLPKAEEARPRRIEVTVAGQPRLVEGQAS